MRDRFALGASVQTVSAELAAPSRMREFGYKRAPGPAMVGTHIAKHMQPVALPSRGTPNFDALPVAQRPIEQYVDRDVALAIREQALEQLAQGNMRLTAAHALRAQEMLDRRVEKQKDREMHVLLARVLTRHQAPPPRYVGPAEDIIEGHAEDIT